jgi:hypothetical protein
MVESIKELRRICYEGYKGKMASYNKYFLMTFSIYITKLLLYTSVTANHVTLMMLALGVIGSIFLFNGYFIIGLILIHLAQLLDSVDGEIARYRKKTSFLGMYFDTLYHVVTTPLMLFGFAYGIYSLYPNNLLILFGFLSAVFSQSVVMPSIFDTICSSKIRDKIPPIDPKVKGENVREFEGQAKEYKSPLLKIYHLIRNIWIFPTNLIILTLLYIWESINSAYIFIPEFSAIFVFFIIYGSLVTLNQIVSFTFHTRKNSIDSFYVFLFGRK